jgi:hypothetical protein
MQAKSTTDGKNELKSRELVRYLPECGFPECDWKPETKMRRETAIRAGADHSVEAGHVRVRQVKVRRIRQVVREEIVG